jgi:membrane protein
MSELVHLRRFLRALLRRVSEDGGWRLSGSLAYTTLLAVVPLLAVGLSIFSAFPAFGDLTGSIRQFLSDNVLPETISRVVLGYIDQFTSNAVRLTAIGLVMLALTSFLMMATIEQAFNTIWRVRQPRAFMTRLTLYWSVMTLGPVLVGASLMMTTALVDHSIDVAGRDLWIAPRVLSLWPIAFLAAAFTFLYAAVPGRRVLFRHALVGGLFAAVVFQVMNRLFAAYVGTMHAYTLVYGTFAAVPLFLIWIYLCWAVVILGAEVVALAPQYRHLDAHARSAPGRGVFAALLILRELLASRRAGRALDALALVQTTHLAIIDAEVLLEALEAAGFVARVPGERWVLACDETRTRQSDVFDAIVLRPASDVGGASLEPIDPLLARVRASLEQPLAALIEDQAAD